MTSIWGFFGRIASGTISEQVSYLLPDLATGMEWNHITPALPGLAAGQ
jgi:hypothetical protein